MHENGSQAGSSLTQRLGAMGHKFLSEVVASLLATGVITAATTVYWHVSTPETTAAAVPAPVSVAPAVQPAPQLTASLPAVVVPPRPVARPRVDKRVRKLEAERPEADRSQAERPVSDAAAPVLQAAAAPAIDEPLFDSGVPVIALVSRPPRPVQPASEAKQTEPVSRPVMAAAVTPPVAETTPAPAAAKPQAQESSGPVGIVLDTASNGLKAVQGVGNALLNVIP